MLNPQIIQLILQWLQQKYPDAAQDIQTAQNLYQSYQNKNPDTLINEMEKRFGDKYPHVLNNVWWNGIKGQTAEGSIDYIKNIMNSFGLNKV